MWGGGGLAWAGNMSDDINIFSLFPKIYINLYVEY